MSQRSACLACTALLPEPCLPFHCTAPGSGVLRPARVPLTTPQRRSNCCLLPSPLLSHIPHIPRFLSSVSLSLCHFPLMCLCRSWNCNVFFFLSSRCNTWTLGHVRQMPVRAVQPFKSICKAQLSVIPSSLLCLPPCLFQIA